ncbi:MAG: hypothetical protein DCF16_13180 [Alphaproteobacteria bacterium]|nr:MAG: hypothetical protein DCF16_13180 [Alphaproteobacteria bacterium]
MLIHRLYDRAFSHGDSAALSVGGQRLNYRAFAMLIEATRLYLNSAKPAGATFALVGASSLDGWLLTIAARAVGLHSIVLSGPKQILDLNLGVRAVVLTMGAAPAPAFAEAATRSGSPIIAVPPSAFAAPPVLDKARLPKDDACGGHVLLTSGTTGRYKKILVDCAAEAARAEALGALFKADEKSVLFMGPMGLWTSAGHNRPLATWYRGGRVVLEDSSNLAQSILREGVNQLQTTVPFLATILDQLPSSFRRDDSIRVGLVGSSPPWALVERAQVQLSRDINIELGSTEAGTIASSVVRTPDDLRFHHIVPERSVIVVDEAGNQTPTGVAGLVKIRLRDNDVRSYFEAPEETARFFQGDWFLSGDLGRLDASGRLELLGRITDVISINGDKHSTLPYEQALERKLAVTGAAILSAPNERGEDELHVALESFDQTLVQQAPAVSAMFPTFRRVHVRIVAQLPRNHMGKIDRLALRAVLGLG